MPLAWIKAKVGFHWQAGEFNISGFEELRAGQVVARGYELSRNRQPLGKFPTLEAAQAAAGRKAQP